MTSEPIIHLHNVHFRYPGQERDTLAIPDLQIQRGGHLFIRGSSGSGKTTLLNLIAGIECPSSGEARVLGEDLQGLSSTRRDRFRVDHLGVIFQQFNLLPYLSLLENVQLPCWFSRRRRQLAGDVGEAATRLLEELQIPRELFHNAVSALSVGQQQRVAVARAVIGRPEIIIADEPTSALDADNRRRFMELLFAETDRQGSTLVFVSHDAYVAEYFPRVIELAEVNEAGA
ncbi:MAG: putative ABC transport system ATP-binding protein [Candidatus Kentron sp. G]|nr:MAG: putative ABC transport system ATP-binding protein [Candidatus Kentron sp. G]VFM98704.1 MAG: putative ABC transport system ATP-binding protein [Candidatus Kentron sp. G]VFN00831.1 MAG: putative ABC transport system ATP-binding protein [Candidatus Kentron sp. G]